MTRTTSWSNIGKSVTGCKNLDQVLQASGLDYEVTKEPVALYKPSERISVIPNRFVTTRNTDGHMYDVVSDKFQIVQNRDAFDFVQYMGDELEFEKAGETSNGMVYIIGKLPEVNILGDKFTPHVIFRNGFSGKVKITAAICPLRIVCQNQFNFAFKNTQNTLTIRHVGNAEAKLQEARDVLKVSADYMQELNRMAEQYVGMKLNPVELERVMNILFPMDGADKMNAFKRNRLEVARNDFMTAYNTDDNANFRGTAWGLVNAYTDLMTHKKPMGNSDTKDEGKFMMVTFHPAFMNEILNVINIVRTGVQS